MYICILYTQMYVCICSVYFEFVACQEKSNEEENQESGQVMASSVAVMLCVSFFLQNYILLDSCLL